MEKVEKSFIQPGYILLYRSNRFISKAIRYFLKCPYHHVGLVIEVYDELFVAESKRQGLSINRLNDSIKGSKIMVLKPKFDYNPVEIGKFVVPLLGKHRYDIMSLYIFQLIYILTGKWLGKKDEHASKRLYCSEFVAYVFHSLYNIFHDWFKTHPKMIYQSPDFDHFILINK